MIVNIVIAVIIFLFVGFSNIWTAKKASNLVCKHYIDEAYNKAKNKYDNEK